jgi:predicted O-methyltransferase YrrM
MFRAISTLFWFLRRPRYWTYFPSRVWTKIIPLKPHSSPQNLQLTNFLSNSILSRSDFVNLLCGAPLVSFQEAQRDLYEHAKSLYDSLPNELKMGGAADLDLVYSVVKHLRPSRNLETGVAHGWSTLAILAGLDRPNATLQSVDLPYINSPKERLVAHLVPENLKKNWYLLKYPDSLGTRIAIRKLGVIDFFHYDSDKRYRQKKRTLFRVYKSMRVGGVMLVDDVGDNSAFFDFCKQVSAYPLVCNFQSKQVGGVRKS